MVQRQKAAFQLLISHQQFTETIEPTVRDLNDPPPGFFDGVAFQLSSFLSAPLHVGNVTVLFDDA